MIKSAELFAGGGGLVLGTGLAGAHHVALAEWNRWACDTLRNNQAEGYPLLQGARVFEGDVRDIDWAEAAQGVDLLAGGPPCQPFSSGGLSRAADDPRDMFPAMTDAIQQVQPRAFIVENVKGLTRTAFAEYYSYIKLRLTYPTLRAKEGESWVEHLERLRSMDNHGSAADLSYRLVDTVVDAADYGVPQHRHRVFLVGFRADVIDGWSFPAPTHSGAALRAAAIRRHHPVWNTYLDGLGNHDPGKGRYEGMKPLWDHLHPGRPWATKLKAQRPETPDEVATNVLSYLNMYDPTKVHEDLPEA